MDRSDLTYRQWEVLDFIADHVRVFLRMPTIQEILDRFKLSGKNGVVDHLDHMELKGFVIRITGKNQRLAFLTVKCRDHFGLWFRDGTEDEMQERETITEEEDNLRAKYNMVYVQRRWRRKYGQASN